MNKKKVKKVIMASGVLGGVLCMNPMIANATENEATFAIEPTSENVNYRSSFRGQVVNVDGTYLRIRQLPSTDSEILSTMTEGTKFDILSQNNDWYKIQYDGVTGYVHGSYVEEVQSTSQESVLSYGKVDADPNLRVRTSASLNASVMGYVSDGETVSIVGSEGDWYKINYNSGYGYVHRDYVITNGAGNDSNAGGSESNESTEINKTGYAYNLDGTSLRVRTGPSTNNVVIGSLYEGNTVNVISREGNWYKISYDNSTAYVSADYITFDNSSSGSGNNNSGNSSNDGSIIEMRAKGTVINVHDSNLRVRQSNSTDSYVLGYLLNNSVVDILAKEGNWYKITFNESVGYVSVDYIRINDDSASNGNSSNTNGNNSSSSTEATYNAVLDVLKSQIGAPYVWGGSGEYLTTGLLNDLKARFPYEAAQGEYAHAERYADQGYRAFDCSGFMQWGFGQAGISIGRTTYSQIYSGVEVSLNSVQPGDLLFTEDLGHVGMYIGNDQWIHSSYTGDTVKISTVYWNSIGRARRVL